jgi:hypothetical protein
MPRPAQLSVSLLDPAGPLGSDDLLIGAMNDVVLPGAGLPLLVVRAGLLGVRTIDEIAASLTALLAWSAGHPEWLIVGATLEWETLGKLRRVLPVARGGQLLQAVVATGSLKDVRGELAAVRQVVVGDLAVVVVDEVEIAIDLDSSGKAIDEYVKTRPGVGADVHLALRAPGSAGAGVPRGHVARDKGAVIVVRDHDEVSLARIGRGFTMQSADLDPNPRKTTMVRIAGRFVAQANGELYTLSPALALDSEAAEAATPPQPVAHSGLGLAQLAGKRVELPRLEDMSEQLSDKLPSPEGKFSPTAEQLESMKSTLSQPPTQLNDALKAFVQEAWSRVPPEHVIGAKFDFIYRDKEIGEIVSLYDGERAIAIRIPGNARRLFLGMTMKDTDWMICAMRGRSNPGNTSFWFRGPNDRDAPHADMIMMKHGARHELGHAIDGATEFSTWCLDRPQFGGWRRADNGDLSAWVMALMQDAAAQAASSLGLNSSERLALLAKVKDREAIRSSLGTEGKGSSCFGVLCTAAGLKEGAKRWKRQGEGWQSFLRLAEPLKTAAIKALDALDRGIERPYLYPIDRGVVLNGRIYHVDYNNDRWSYLESPAIRRVSNYQFCNPKEWFAEMYSFYFDTPDDLGAYIRAVGDDVNANWFRDQLGPGGALLATNGLRKLS